MSINKNLYCNTIGGEMGYAVKAIMRMLINAFKEENINLTLEQYFLLNILNNEDGLILQDLANIVDRDKSAVYHHIDGLETNHFVARTTDAEDKRRKLLFITKPGVKVLERALRMEEKVIHQVTDEISSDEITRFERTLTTICNKALCITNS